jgi:hypothetical protein
MKRIFIVSITLQLLFTTNAFTQFPLNYRAYYDSISLAELRTVELDFQNAYTIYQKTFSEYEKRHLNDLHNATLCAILVGENNQAKVWIMEMITKGVDISTLNSHIFKKLPENIWAEIKQNNNFLRSVYLSRIDSNYYKVLDSLRAREQDYLINRKSQTSYDSLIYEHAKVLHALIKVKGISPVPIFGKFQLPLDVLLHHFGLRNRLKYAQQSEIDLSVEPYKSMDFAPYDLEPLLTQAVFNGDLSPSFLASAMAHSELDPARQLGAFTIIVNFDNKTITLESASDDNLNKIDLFRKSIGLEAASDAAKKDIFVALYLNPITFPFDEHIRQYKEIGYNKKKLEFLEKEEFLKISRVAARMGLEIRLKFLKSDTNSINCNSDKKSLYIENKFDILKEFRFSQSIVQSLYLIPEL